MMKRVAIPITDGKLCEFFGKCNHFEIFDLDSEGNAINQASVTRVDCMDNLPNWADNNGITDIIAYRMERSIFSEFMERKISLYIGAPRSIGPDELIDDFLSGSLRSCEKIINEIFSLE